MARVLLLMPTNSYHAADFVAAAAALDVDLTVGTNGSQALAARTPGATLRLDFGAQDAALGAVREFHAQFPLAAVVASDDESAELAAATAAELGLPHNRPAAVAATRSKRRLRATLRDAGVPSPAFQVLDFGPGFANEGRPERVRRVKAAATGLLDAVAFPCVLKPTFLAASRGVIRADDAVEFRAAAARIGEILHQEMRSGGTNPESHLVLVEDYVPGTEYAFEGMLRGGELHPLAIFDKPDPLTGPYFEETIYVTPSRSPQAVQADLLDTVRRAVAHLGLREGPLHAEVRVNNDGAFIIDLAARSMGGLCPRVLRFGAGASLEELILRHALGEDFAGFERRAEAGGVMMIPIPGAGVFRGVHGLGQAREVAGIRDITITVNPGQRLVPLPEGNRYLGFIFAAGAEPAGAEVALRTAHAALRLEIEPASP